jgi:hypothetical protein
MNAIQKVVPGNSWSSKYLHPPSSDLEFPVTGYPDRDSTSSVVLEWRGTQEISGSMMTIPVVASWSCLIIQTTFPERPAIALLWEGEIPASVAAISIIYVVNTSFNFGNDNSNWLNAAQRWRVIASSGTTYLNSAALYNQGRCWGNQLRARIDPFSGVSGTPLSYVINLGIIPVLGSQIIQQSARAYTGLARDGCYTPMSIGNPVLNYQIVQSTGTLNLIGSVNTLAGSQVLNIDLTPGTKESDIPHLDWNFSFQLFAGLLPQETLEHKWYRMLELGTQPGSPFSAFISPGAFPDESQIENAYRARYEMMDSYPASANDMASILSAIRPYLPIVRRAYTTAKPIFQAGVATLPGGSLVNQVTDALEDLVLRSEKTSISKSARKRNKQKIKRDLNKILPLQASKTSNGRPITRKLPQTPQKPIKMSNAQLVAALRRNAFLSG